MDAGGSYHEGERYVQERAGERDRALRLEGFTAGPIPIRALAFLAEQRMLAIGSVDEHDPHHLAGHRDAGHLGWSHARRGEELAGGRAERRPPVGRILLHVPARTEIRRIRLGVGGDESAGGIVERRLVAARADVMGDDEASCHTHPSIGPTSSGDGGSTRPSGAPWSIP